MPRTAKQYSDEVKELFARADAEGRDPTPAERAHVEQLLESGESMHRIEQQMKQLGGDAPSFVTRTDPNWSNTAAGAGDVFIKSAGYQRIADPAGRGQTWSTGPVEVSSIQLVKGTMLETGVAGPGGGLVAPQYEPAIVLFEPLGVRDVFGQSQTNASQVRYVVEGTALSGAAGVAEAGVKPESTIAMSEVVEPVKKIATTLPISDELLEDAPSIQSYLNGRLTPFISIEEERAAAARYRHERADRPVQPDRRPGHKSVHKIGLGRLGDGDREGHREHPRLEFLAAGQLGIRVYGVSDAPSARALATIRVMPLIGMSGCRTTRS